MKQRFKLYPNLHLVPFISSIEKREFFQGLLESAGCINSAIVRDKTRRKLVCGLSLHLDACDSSYRYLMDMKQQLNFGYIYTNKHVQFASKSRSCNQFVATYPLVYSIQSLSCRKQIQILKQLLLYFMTEVYTYNAVTDNLLVMQSLNLLSSQRLTCQQQIIAAEKLHDQVLHEWNNISCRSDANFLLAEILTSITADVQKLDTQVRNVSLQKSATCNELYSNNKLKDDVPGYISTCKDLFKERDYGRKGIIHVNYSSPKLDQQMLYGILQRVGKFCLKKFSYTNRFGITFKSSAKLGNSSLLYHIKNLQRCNSIVNYYNRQYQCCVASDPDGVVYKYDGVLVQEAVFLLSAQEAVLELIVKILDNQVINPLLSDKFIDAYKLMLLLRSADHKCQYSRQAIFDFYKQSSIGPAKKSQTVNRWQKNLLDQQNKKQLYVIDQLQQEVIIKQKIAHLNKSASIMIHCQNVQRRLSSGSNLSHIGVAAHTNIALIQETGRHIQRLPLHEPDWHIVEQRRSNNSGGILLAIKRPQKVLDWAMTATAVFMTIQQPGQRNHLRAASIYMPPQGSPLLIDGRIVIDKQFDLLTDLAQSQRNAHHAEVVKENRNLPASELDIWLQDIEAKDGWLASPDGEVVEGVGEQSYQDYVQYVLQKKTLTLQPLIGNCLDNRHIVDPTVKIIEDKITVYNADDQHTDVYQVLDNCCAANYEQIVSKVELTSTDHCHATDDLYPTLQQNNEYLQHTTSMQQPQITQAYYSKSFRACYGGDFNPGSGPLINAASSQLSQDTLSHRKRLISRFMDALDLHLLNGTDPSCNGQATFSNSRGHTSTPDLMLVSEGFRDELERGGGGMLTAKGVGDHRALLTYSKGVGGNANEE